MQTAEVDDLIRAMRIIEARRLLKIADITMLPRLKEHARYKKVNDLLDVAFQRDKSVLVANNIHELAGFLNGR